MTDQNEFSFEIIISANKMQVFVEVKDGTGGTYPTEASFRDGLREKGIEVDLIEETLQKVFEEPEFFRKELIGVGVEPIHGDDAFVKYEVTFADEPIFIPDDSDEKVDYREAIQFVLVKKGEKIAELIPPSTGESGKNVFGKLVPSQAGKGLSVKDGNGVERRGNEFFATQSGLPKCDNGLFKVEDVLEIKGSVCMKTGNVKYPGAVVVHGDLEDSFEIISDDDVKVMGTMGDAIVKAKGNVTIVGGVLGRERAEIRCGGRLEVKFCQNVSLEVNGNIIVTKDLRHCKVNTLGSIQILKGSIIGGEITAFHSVISPEIGSESAPKTKIRVGYNYEIDKLENVMKSLFEVATKVEQKHKAALENSELSVKELPQFLQSVGLISQLVERAETVKKQIRMRQDLEDKEKEKANSVQVKVKRRIWPEVTLLAPNCHEDFKSSLEGERTLLPNVEEGNFKKV